MSRRGPWATRSRSIARHLVITLSAVHGIALILSTGALLTNAWLDAEILPERSAAAFANALAASVSRSPEGVVATRPGESVSAVIAANPGARYAVLDLASGRVVMASTPPLLDRPPPDWFNALEVVHFRVAGTDKSPRDGLLRTVDTPAGPLLVAWVGDRRSAGDSADWLLNELGGELLPVLLPLFAATLLIGPFAVRRALRPLRVLSKQATELTPSASSTRLEEARAPTEIQPLVAAVNLAFDRMANAFEHQRRFTANVAHELRMPLSILMARVEDLRASTRSDATEEGLAALSGGIDRMARLVDQLLMVARLESRQVALDQRVDLSALARELIARVAPLAIQQGREIALVGDASPHIVMGNATVIEHAARNLVDNALRHAPRGSVVEIVLSPSGGFEVSDQGPGVAEADRERIFQPFARGPDRDATGTGLGLAIAREAATLHGGSVHVHERVGGGACFVLHLPPAVAS